ncbi:hypothetical protein Tco_1435439, partial [Tanacetum coccineum]
EPLPHLPKLPGAKTIGTSNNAIPLADLIQTLTVSDKTKQALKILKPFIPHKYYGFSDHHSDECEYYPGCDVCGSITHDPADCDKKTTSNNRKPRIANQRSNKPTDSGFTKKLYFSNVYAGLLKEIYMVSR